MLICWRLAIVNAAHRDLTLFVAILEPAGRTVEAYRAAIHQRRPVGGDVLATHLAFDSASHFYPFIMCPRVVIVDRQEP